MIVLDHLSYCCLELGDVLLSSLVHHFGYLYLALMECPDRVTRRCKFLPRTAHTRVMEVDLLQGLLSVRVFFVVDSLDDLEIVEVSVCSLAAF